MAEAHDPVTPTDIDAYVDDQLEDLRRIAVEAHLAAHPRLAARVMADLRLRDELRLALADQPMRGRPATAEAARRLGRALVWDGRRQQLTRLAAAVTLVASGWLAHATLKPASVSASPPHPAYLTEAVQAHDAVMLRASMHSQTEANSYDPAEIRSATGIVLPVIPGGWSVRDAQVFPSPTGPSVEVAFETDALGPASLFAVRPGSFDVVTPTAAPDGAHAAAYFQMGDVAYVLVAGPQTDTEDLRQAAARLSASLY